MRAVDSSWLYQRSTTSTAKPCNQTSNAIYLGTEAYSEPCQTSMLDPFSKQLTAFNVNYFRKKLHFWLGSKYTYDLVKFALYKYLVESEAE